MNVEHMFRVGRVLDLAADTLGWGFWALAALWVWLAYGADVHDLTGVPLMTLVIGTALVGGFSAIFGELANEWRLYHSEQFADDLYAQTKIEISSLDAHDLFYDFPNGAPTEDGAFGRVECIDANGDDNEVLFLLVDDHIFVAVDDEKVVEVNVPDFLPPFLADALEPTS